MISRVAECCFWLHRHAERAESMARLLRVNRSFLLDLKILLLTVWQVLLRKGISQEGQATMTKFQGNR